MIAAPAFPLAGPVAFVGSRHGSPWSPVPVVAAVLDAGGVPVVGCAPGVDQAVRLAAGEAAVVLRAAELFPQLLPAARLAHRTRAVVRASHALALFPPAGVLGPGSLLAARVALELGQPLWVAGEAPPACLAGPWEALPLAGGPGWLAVSPPSLF